MAATATSLQTSSSIVSWRPTGGNNQLIASRSLSFSSNHHHYKELGIGVVTYSPLGRGLFGGKAVIESVPADSFLDSHPRFHGENLEKNKSIYTRMAGLAEKHGCSPAQLALAWILHQGDGVVPIPGTTKIKNVDDNIGSLKVKLTKEDIMEICNAVPLDEVAGSKSYETVIHLTWKFANTPPKA